MRKTRRTNDLLAARHRDRLYRARLVIAGIMSAVALTCVGWHYIACQSAAAAYGSLALGMDKPTVRYLMGGIPTTGTIEQPAWSYAGSGRTYRLDFDPRNRLTRISCRPDTDTPGACPAVLSAEIGISENALIARLGRPNLITNAGNERWLDYNGIGFRFVLSRGEVVGIEHASANSTADLWRVILWQITA